MEASNVRPEVQAAGNPNAAAQLERRARLMPGKVRIVTISAGILQAPVGKHYIDDARSLDIDKVAKLLDSLSDRERRKVLRSLHKPLAPVLEHALDSFSRGPYTSGYTRRAFRAPSRPDWTAYQRMDWLRQLGLVILPFQEDADWFATWLPYLAPWFAAQEGPRAWSQVRQDSAELVGRLLAAAIDLEVPGVLETLIATVDNNHPTARMTRAVPYALLASSDPRAWDAVERLLLAAQRQEGLRQSILEVVDFAHPQAYRRMIRLMLDHGLCRFAAAIRAVGVWFGESFEVRDRKVVEALLEQLLLLLDDPDARAAAIDSAEALDVYLGLWASAFHDAPAALPEAARVASSNPVAEARLASVRLLVDLLVDESIDPLIAALGDEDLRVVAVAADALAHRSGMSVEQEDRYVVRLRSLIERLGAKKQDHPVGIIRPATATLGRADLADRVVRLSGRRGAPLAWDLISLLSADGRWWLADAAAQTPDRHREELLAFLSDRSSGVREIAFGALQKAGPPRAHEVEQLEDLLKRKAADARRGVLTMLVKLPDREVVNCATRLADGTATQQLAATELATTMIEAGRALAAVTPIARALADSDVSETDRQRLELALAPASAKPVSRLADVDELINHDRRTPTVLPATTPVDWGILDTQAAQILSRMDAWLHEHRDVEVTVTGWQGPQIQLLVDVERSTFRGMQPGVAWETRRTKRPLPTILDPWWELHGPTVGDGVAALLAEALTQPFQQPEKDRGWEQPLYGLPQGERAVASQLPQFGKAFQAVRHPWVTLGLLRWAGHLAANEQTIGRMIDVAIAALEPIPSNARQLPNVAMNQADVRTGVLARLVARSLTFEQIRPELVSHQDRARLWQLARWFDEPQGHHRPVAGKRDLTPETPTVFGGMQPSYDVPIRPARMFVDGAFVRAAVDAGLATADDLRDHLLSERTRKDLSVSHFGVSRGGGFGFRNQLGEFTRRSVRRPSSGTPTQIIVDQLVSEMLEIEVVRGELPTPVSEVITGVRNIVGTQWMFRILGAFRKQRFVRGYMYGGSRELKT